MKQILQSLSTGLTEVAEVPSPGARPGRLLVHSHRSLISSGTERMLVEFGQASLVAKARQQPDKVRAVVDKVLTDGLAPTLAAVRGKLAQPLALGYSNVGVVVEVGRGVSGFAVGDRVASNGPHAEVVCVPFQLCARVPDTVSDDQAAFTVLGSIALQGVRLVQPTLGEAVVVTGLGLIGLLAVQLLRANGCRVLGIDFDPERLALARRFGAETVDLGAGADPVAVSLAFSRGRGVDAVLLTASTQSNEPLHQAALMCRQRGRIVLTGVAGLNLSRDDFYRKELTFQVSSSYGPGRYDGNYEDKGLDYPVGFVRWTEQRNFEAVLDMMADRRIDIDSLISHRFAIERAAEAYALVTGDQPSLGIVLEYPGLGVALARSTVSVGEGGPATPPRGTPAVSFIGAGNYATAVLIPAFKLAGAQLRSVASSGGVSSLHAARRFGFAQATTDTGSVLADSANDAVVIATRHGSHAGLVIEALEAGKSVFVEKPLCVTLDELDRIEACLHRLGPAGRGLLMVGFNRRFAPHVQKIQNLLAGATGPKAFIMTVNAGALPEDHWAKDPEAGGGRIVGEGCHFIDLLRFLAAAPIVGHQSMYLGSSTSDTGTIDLKFGDGSIGTIHYFANGSRRFPKERLEVFVAGRTLRLDNFRILSGFGWPGFTTMRLWKQDKGQRACAAAFVAALKAGGPSPIPEAQILEVSRVTIEVASG